MKTVPYFSFGQIVRYCDLEFKVVAIKRDVHAAGGWMYSEDCENWYAQDVLESAPLGAE